MPHRSVTVLVVSASAALFHEIERAMPSGAPDLSIDRVLVSNSADCFPQVRLTHPSLIIVDSEAGPVDCFTLVGLLRSQDACADVPILLLAADPDIAAREQELNYVLFDYIATSGRKGGDFSDRFRRALAFRLRSYMSFIRIIRRHRHAKTSVDAHLVTILENINYYNDESTGSHARRLNACAALLAEKAGLSPVAVASIGRFASIHDIGKVAIPAHILKKTGKLTPEEFAVMKQHCFLGVKIVEGCDGIGDVARNIILRHHERWDGQGYPDGLAGEAIPEEARVVSAVDVYDALRSERPYKERMSHADAMHHVVERKGRAFCPKMVDTLVRAESEFERLYEKQPRGTARRAVAAKKGEQE